MIIRLRRTLFPVFIIALLLALGHGAALSHSSRRQAEARELAEEKRALVGILPSAELFLSSSARWIRHPALSEEMAPFADSPSALDLDPAGALHPPLSLHLRSDPKKEAR